MRSRIYISELDHKDYSFKISLGLRIVERRIHYRKTDNTKMPVMIANDTDEEKK